MRLLYTDESGRLKWTEDLIGDKIPPYAILSHTWEEGHEVTFDDLKNRDAGKGVDEEDKHGYRKISFCAKQAKYDGLVYFWVDTCCIDKTNSVELQEAINSMFRWYENAKRCYVYLSDVEGHTLDGDGESYLRWTLIFKESRWFTRGWTLQELLAPVSVDFFSKEGKRLGNKKSFEKVLQEITGIPIGALPGTQLCQFSVEQRFSWAAHRQTTREEDGAYSLLGIFGVHLPLIYGEGKRAALKRLKREIRESLGNVRGTTPEHDTGDPVESLENWQRRICTWLSAPDPTNNYHKATKQRQADTGLWLLESAKYAAWVTDAASRLWLHGIPGCGKTILSSTIIENLSKHCSNKPDMVTVYFYFDFKDTLKQDPELMLRSLLCQLVQRSVTTFKDVSTLFLTCGNGQRKPSQDAVLEVTLQIMQTFSRIYVVLDALDECTQRTELLGVLGTMTGWQLKNMSLLMTSRKEREIESSLADYVKDTDTICLQNDVVDKDIQRYVRQRLSDDKSLFKWNKDAAIRQEIEVALMCKARGMFRWAACQLDTLGKCHNRAMLRKALATLPATLDLTYERILSAISEEESEYAMRILRWLAFSARPLSLEEVAEVIAIDVTRDRAFDRDEVLEDPLDALSICSSLVTRVMVMGRRSRAWGLYPTIALAHYSVKEYLVSDRIKLGRTKQYSLRELDCHDTIARACLRYLVQFAQPRICSEDSVGDHALARYSARYWFDHLRNTGELMQETVQIAVNLLSMENPAFLAWIKLCIPEYRWRGSDRLMPNPLFHAALLGLSNVVKQLLNAGADVNMQDEWYGSALMAASLGGHENTVKTLLESGADVNMHSGEDGSALEAATYKNRKQTVEMLLNAGANVQGADFSRAFEVAVYCGYKQIFKMLSFASSRKQDTDFSGAFGVASTKGFQQVVELPLRVSAKRRRRNAMSLGSATPSVCVANIDSYSSSLYGSY